MITKELTDYIKNKLAQGVERGALSRLLVSNGWENEDVDEAFVFLGQKTEMPAISTPPSVQVQQPVQASPQIIIQPQSAKPLPTFISENSAQVQTIKPEVKPEIKPEVVSTIATQPKIVSQATETVRRVQSPVASPANASQTSNQFVTFQTEQKTQPQPQQPKIQSPQSQSQVQPKPQFQSPNQSQQQVQQPYVRPQQPVQSNSTNVQPVLTPTKDIEKNPMLMKNAPPANLPVQPSRQNTVLTPTSDIEKNPMLIKNVAGPAVVPSKFKTFAQPRPQIPPPPISNQKIAQPQVQSVPSVPSFTNAQKFSASPIPQTSPVQQINKIPISAVPNLKVTPIGTVPVQPAVKTPRPVPIKPIANKNVHAGPTLAQMQTSAPFVNINATQKVSPLPNPSQKTEATIEKPKHSKKLVFTLVSILIGLLIFGAGAYFYFFHFKNANQISKKIAGALSLVDSFNFSLTADVAVPSSKNGAPEDTSTTAQVDHFIFNAVGSYDETTANNPKLDSTISVTAPVLFDKPYTAGLKMIAGKLFLSMPKVGLLELIIPRGLLPDDGTWIQLTGDDLKDLAIQNPSVKNIVLSGNGEPRTDVLSANQIAKIKKTLISSNIVILGDKTGTETIGTMTTDHYHFTVNEVGFFKAISKIKNEILGGTAEAASTDQIVEQIKNNQILGGDIWIGQNEYLPYKLVLTVENSDRATQSTGTTTNISVTFSDYNKKTDIVEPDGFVLLHDILEKMKGTNNQSDAKNLLQSAQSSAKVFAEKNDGHYNGICGSKNGFSVLLSDVAKNNGGIKPHCNSAKDGWIIYMQYGADKNTYQCLDATGVSKQTQGPIIGITCPLN